MFIYVAGLKMEMVYPIGMQGEDHKQGHEAILTVMLEK